MNNKLRRREFIKAAGTIVVAGSGSTLSGAHVPWSKPTQATASASALRFPKGFFGGAALPQKSGFILGRGQYRNAVASGQPGEDDFSWKY